MPQSGKFSFLVEAFEAGKRLDSVIASRLVDCSRSLISELIRAGHIRVSKESKKPGYKVRLGESIAGHIPPPEPIHFEPEPIPLHILHEDNHIVVVNKAPGCVVHPAPGHMQGTLVNALLHHCPDLSGIGGKLRPGIVHRLDKDTSGTVVVAKTAFAHEALADQFKRRKVAKKYRAVVYGEVKKPNGEIELPIGRHPVHRKRMSTLSPTGRSALTRYTVLERFEKATVLELDIKTGRTHQIRVHCAAIHHPVVGDDIYAGRHRRSRNAGSTVALCFQKHAQRQMLHAHQLTLQHPQTGAVMTFESPIPADMRGLIDCLRQTAIH